MNSLFSLTQTLRISVLSVLAGAALLTVLFFGVTNAYASVDRSLDIGSTGSDVTELQTYLAQDSSIYPEGRVTGYFGALTAAAIQRFQTAQGIVTSGTPATTGYGRVGPTTRARLNSLMGGVGLSGYAPSISAVTVQVTGTTATLTWGGNPLTTGQVFYDTAFVRANEATGPKQLPYVSGTQVLDSNGLQANHTVTLQNLTPNTTYYFLVRSIDASGEMSMTWPPGSFHTN